MPKGVGDFDALRVERYSELKSQKNRADNLFRQLDDYRKYLTSFLSQATTDGYSLADKKVITDMKAALKAKHTSAANAVI